MRPGRRNTFGFSVRRAPEPGDRGGLFPDQGRGFCGVSGPCAGTGRKKDLDCRGAGFARRAPAFVALAGSAVILAAALAGAGLPPAPDWLPADTVAWVTVPDTRKFQAEWQELAVARWWRDPVMGPLRQHFLKAWEERVLRPAEQQWAVSWGELAGWLQGQWTLGVVCKGGADGDRRTNGVVMALEVGDRSERVRDELAKVRERWELMGRSVRSETVRGVPVVVLSVPDGGWLEALSGALRSRAEPEQRAGSERAPVDVGGAGSFLLALGLREQVLWLSDSLPLLEEVFAGLDGGPVRTLRQGQGVSAEDLAGLSGAMVFGWAAPARWLSAGAKQGEDGGDGEGDAVAAVERLAKAVGLAPVRSLSMRVQSMAQGWSVDCRLDVPAGERTRLMRLVNFEGLEAMPPEWVPAGVLRFYRYRLQGRQVWSGLEEAAAAMGPVWGRVWSFLVETVQQAGRQRRDDFDLMRDVVNRLGDDWIYFEEAPRVPGWQGLERAPGLWLVGSGEATQLARAIAEVLAGAALRTDALQEREFLGRTIYSVPMPFSGPPMEPGGEGERVHISASERYVGFARQPGILESWLRALSAPSGESLVTRPGWRETVAAAGGGRGWVGFEDYAGMMRHLMEALRSDPEGFGQARLPGPLGFRLQLHMAGEEWRPWLDPALVPPWEAWDGYAGAGWLCAQVDTETIRLRFTVTAGPRREGGLAGSAGGQSPVGGR